jgi:predicted nucleic acid-binding Zn ribbon protein
LAPKHCLMADDAPGTKKIPCSTEILFVLQVNKKRKKRK